MSFNDSPSTAHSHPSSSGPTDSEPTVQYTERLTVAWWMWLVVLFLGAATFIALAPLDVVVGIVAALVMVVIVALILQLGSPRIVVTDQDLRVGRAYIERRFVGQAEALKGDAVRVARGPELDGRAFMNFRVSVPDICRIEIVDPVDPTPYWLTSTRHPDKLAEVINASDTAPRN